MKAPTDGVLTLPQILLRSWWVIMCCAAIGSVVAAVYALKMPNWYSARIGVLALPPASDGGAQGSRLSTGSEALLSAGQRIQAVLSSTSVADEVIEKFELEQHYGVPNRDAARAELGKHCTTSIDRRSGIVSLACEDLDPRIAMEMAASFGEVGNRVFGRVSASSAREERTFLEAQVAKVRGDVDEASRKLRDFQRANNIIDLPEQSRAVISAMAALKGEIVSKQLELSYQSTFAADTEASVTQLRRQIRILARKLRSLEATNPKAPTDFFPAAKSVADMRFELEQLVREQRIQETLFFTLSQRYESAKVDEARDTSTFQILDHPTQPAYPSRPRRAKTALLGALVGLVAACVLCILRAWWREQINPPTLG
jgi:tyrosine-protein kinase Etk/Wzc